MDQEEQPATAVELTAVTCRFGPVRALTSVDLRLAAGEIRALLGPNGAGKTTLLRVAAGLVHPSAGSVSVLGRRPSVTDGRSTQSIGVAPSGDRSFYLRLTGVENLVFFARMHGLPRREAVDRALEYLATVGLSHGADQRVGLYSHGMRKRLTVARALITEPTVLLLDEPTHDLDLEGAARIRSLATERATRGAAVLWATQLLDEIRGFAHSATVLDQGHVRFEGSVRELLARTTTQRFLLRVDLHDSTVTEQLARMRAALGHLAWIDPTPDAGHYLLGLGDGVVLGEVLLVLGRAGVRLLACNEDGSLVGTALLRLLDEARIGSAHAGPERPARRTGPRARVAAQ